MEAEIYSDYKKDINSQEKIKELDELIDLSEKVSDKVSNLTKRRNFAFLSIISSGVILISIFISFFIYVNRFTMIKSDEFYLLASASMSILGLILSYSIIERRKVNNEIENEIEILDKLYEMITNLKETTDLGIVSKAIYEMRLSRIQFSYKTKR